jgi:hemerythrin-like domain-containing protein
MTFFREFADLLHHEKEESLLLPALVLAGLRWDDGVLADIRKDHELERQMLQTLRHAALQSSPWSLMDQQRVIDVGRRFVEFTRQHIDTEDGRLHPLVPTKLDGPALSELNKHLDRFDARMETSGELNMLRELAAALVREFSRV